MLLDQIVVARSDLTMWQPMIVSKYDDLLHINSLAGRSFNDLTQYPVFRCMVVDYTSNTLNLDK